MDEWRSCCWLDRVKIGFGVEPKYSFGCTCTGVRGVKSKVRGYKECFFQDNIYPIYYYYQEVFKSIRSLKYEEHENSEYENENDDDKKKKRR